MNLSLGHNNQSKFSTGHDSLDHLLDRMDQLGPDKWFSLADNCVRVAKIWHALHDQSKNPKKTISAAADLLQVSRKTIYQWLNEAGVDPVELKKANEPLLSLPKTRDILEEMAGVALPNIPQA